MSTKINTLAELQAEKKKLKMQMEVSKQAFFHSFDDTKTQARDFLVHKITFQSGILSLVTLGLKKLKNTPSNKLVKDKGNFFLKIMPFVIPFVQNYFSKPENHQHLPTFLQDLLTPKQ